VAALPGGNKPRPYLKVEEVMPTIGLLVGRERSFPDALIQEINSRETGTTAEYLQIGEIHSDQPSRYAVILDRISHEVVFYQAFLKKAVLEGTIVINNPFWRLADDKFFGTALAHRIGIPVPKTLIIPSRSYPESIVPESLRNLKHPLDWNAIVEYTGLPAILKPHWGGGWKDVHRINSIEELIHVYNRTGVLCMMLQEFIQWQQYVRCICIGKKNVLITNWDPTKSHFERYRDVDQQLADDLRVQIEADAVKINEALGYDMNTVEFAVRDGIPYAIDFMNSAPDFDISSLTEGYFPWVVRTMADLLIDRAKKAARKKPASRWDKFLQT
jgi:glutathione synthase/RimK-type ligase-like ATP-grasp enzyme